MVKFKDVELINLVKVQLNQSSDTFKSEKLLEVEELFLSARNFADEYNFVDLNELKHFKNLKILEMRHMVVSEKDIEVLRSLKKLKELSFVECNIKKCDQIKDLNLEALTLNSCCIDEDDFIYEMNGLRELNVIKGYLNFAKISGLKNLKRLNIASSIVIKVKEADIPTIEEFIVDFSNIKDLTFILNIANLKKISVSREQIEQNEKVIKKLQLLGVEVLENDKFKIQEVKNGN